MSGSLFWTEFPKPIVALAPMEGYSDSAFRQVCKAVNPDIVTYTEFTSADGLHHSPDRVRKKLAFKSTEKPVIAQIFGKHPETFVSAAKLIEDMGFSGIDLNMGCPAKKVVKSEHGVALRKNHALAFKLIESVASATHLPVSVKSRLGWEDDSDLDAFCLGAQSAGASMIAIHARTYAQPYKVAAQWESLYRLKDKLSIPLLGNGGLTGLADGYAKLKHLDGFLIGQAAMGNPWVFSTTNPTPSFHEKIPIIKAHARYLIDDKGERVGCREIRKHLVTYCKLIPNARQWRSELVHVESLAAIESVLDRMADTIPELSN